MFFRRLLSVVSVGLFLNSNALLAQTSGSTTQSTGPEARALEREEQSLLQRHHPFYFAYSSHESKLQASFKTPLVDKWPVYFGYTQLMFWALTADSAPFRDLTYNPELFYRLSLDNAGPLQSIDFGAIEHNSNGKAGDDSRSFNRSYVRFNLVKDGPRWVTRFSTQLSAMHPLETNKNIQDFVGPLSFTISFVQMFDAWIDKSEIALQASPGGKFANRWDYGGYQLSWSFRVGAIHLVPAFYLQYYRGFAETLLNYDKRVNEFRVGVIF